jgi:MoxR-like ATPase
MTGPDPAPAGNVAGVTSPTAPAPASVTADGFRAALAAVEEQIGRVIVGHREVVRQVLTGLFTGGHVLLEGVPGVGKTRMAVALSRSLGLGFQRIQFTPDLMPADITGTTIVAEDPATGRRDFRFQAGPVFTQLLLADEINRATPKTQSALLEAMAEGNVTVARDTHRLPEPFFVLATQNPLEMEGTYPLPEAQLDRFAYKVLLAGPQLAELTAILGATTGTASAEASPVLAAGDIAALRRLVRQVPAASHVVGYAGRLVLATHPGSPYAPPTVKRHVRGGAGPRGGQAILLGAKVSALRAGRSHVDFSDVRSQVLPALRHRLMMSFAARAEDRSPDSVLSDVLAAVPEEERSA